VFLAFKEKQFARRIIRRLLKASSVIRAANPGLSGEALYREILLHTELVDSSNVDQVLWQAEDSVDEWTTHADKVLALRQVAHFVVVSQHQAAGHAGSVISFKNIVYKMIPAEL
jgi:hypothetical protein